MKRIIQTNRFLLLTGMFLFLLTACTKENTTPGSNSNNQTVANNQLQTQIKSLPAEPLSTAEINSLLYMREEEKLAKDVYLTLYNKWGATIFTNIASSEQTHTDAVLLLLNKYGLTDPVTTGTLGVFTDSNLQTLYNQLVLQGSANLLAAYTVGATIEDLDIYDLGTNLQVIDNQDIQLVYNMLLKGSRNHMRSFYKNIVNTNGTYTPQFITQSAFDAIINSPMETGN